MTMMPVGVAKETEIAEAVAEVERSLAPEVVRQGKMRHLANQVEEVPWPP